MPTSQITIGSRLFLQKTLKNATDSDPSVNLIKDLYNIIADHVHARHQQSKFLSWDRTEILAQLTEPDTEFIILFDAETVAAFTCYQFSTENDMNDLPVPVLYCYQLHVLRAYRGLGLGTLLLSQLEALARANPERAHKIMLTAFKPLPRLKWYKSPVEFYTKLGYCPDPISPSQCLKAAESRNYDYEILSKNV